MTVKKLISIAYNKNLTICLNSIYNRSDVSDGSGKKRKSGYQKNSRYAAIRNSRYIVTIWAKRELEEIWCSLFCFWLQRWHENLRLFPKQDRKLLSVFLSKGGSATTGSSSYVCNSYRKSCETYFNSIMRIPNIFKDAYERKSIPHNSYSSNWSYF